ncbi:uncharacterized protein SOCE26_016880 [Sorangium cellulosum]|uniref:Uncharacterized protein n=1 Tax=Sorangium cellulosum TaxID=56 RepID=A0A2L0ELW6_SORCE|nr:uncharacterized protein SOCE26_016880 [Sorangium cellulosum]
MATTLRIGLIGDRSDEVRAHQAIQCAFKLVEREGGPRTVLDPGRPAQSPMQFA